MDKELTNAAQEVLKNAYAKYSRFPVGAAIRTKEGLIITGANVENAAYGLSNCAERSALFSAYSQGIRKEDIVAMAVATKNDSFVSPCGACRQVMRELVPLEADVFLVKRNGDVKTLQNKDLLPHAFAGAELPG